MPRRHPCDVCGHDRKRWQRLCPVCWRTLPGAIRSAVTEHWKAGRKREWRAARRQALEHMGSIVARHMAAYQRTARQLGERDA